MRVLDVGCGPGRHALALADRGIAVHGVDLSPDFVALAREAAGERPATFEVLDVRDLAFDGEFDAAICLCQGGFGLLGGADDEAVIARIARGGPARRRHRRQRVLQLLRAALDRGRRRVRPGHGREPRGRDPAERRRRGDDRRPVDDVLHRPRAVAAGRAAGTRRTCRSPGVTPGDYGIRPVTLDRPELLLLARVPVGPLA